MIDSEVRATIAAIALAHAGDRVINGLYDHSLNRQAKVTAVFEGEKLNGLDLDRRAKLSGQMPDIYDHGRASYIHLAAEGNKYTVYDHKTATHLYVVITDDTAAVYDHDTAAWTQFSLKPIEEIVRF